LTIGGDFPFIGRLGVMFSSCTDGKRSVIFRLERLDEKLKKWFLEVTTSPCNRSFRLFLSNAVRK